MLKIENGKKLTKISNGQIRYVTNHIFDNILTSIYCDGSKSWNIIFEYEDCYLLVDEDTGLSFLLTDSVYLEGN